MTKMAAPDEEGMTLVEVLVASSLLVLVLGSVLGVLATVQQGFEREVDRAVGVDQARLAIEQIQHEVASARAVTVANYISMDVYTRTNEDTRGTSKCVQWRLSSGTLQSRTWTWPWDAGQSNAWRTVATDLTNADTAADKLFELDPSSAYASRLVNITPHVNANPDSGRDVELSGSALGRNIQYGVSDPCATDQPP